MTESFELSVFFREITAERLYRAWLDSAEHTAMTGSPAQIEPHAGGCFTAWDGYIYGSTMELQPFHLIVQAWRTTEFPAEAPGSRLEVWLEEKEGGVQMRLVHSEIPAGQAEDYRQGWESIILPQCGLTFPENNLSWRKMGETDFYYRQQCNINSNKKHNPCMPFALIVKIE